MSHRFPRFNGCCGSRDRSRVAGAGTRRGAGPVRGEGGGHSEDLDSATYTGWPARPAGSMDYRTITPLERPKVLGTKEVFTDEEAAKFEKVRNGRQNRDLIDSERGGLQYPPGGVSLTTSFGTTGAPRSWGQSARR